MAIYLDLTYAQGAGGVVPVGFVSWTLAPGAPTGWLVRDGSAVSRVAYADLFALIGTTYGPGDGVTTFNLPDDRGLVVAGDGLGTALPGLTNHVLGAVFGEEGHVQTVAEMATHTHTQNSHNHTQDAHTHTQNSHNHTQNAHTHTQDAHTHTQDAHTHTQNSHNHVQDAHFHTITVRPNAGGANGECLSFTTGAVTAGGSATDLRTATNQSSTATNQNTTATNQNTTATNQNTTATNIAATATNQNTTATNQATTAVNNNNGSSNAANVIQPTRYYTPILKY